MITIYGKYTNAHVYTTKSEEFCLDTHARAQIQMLCDHPGSKGAMIRVMPDVHAAKLATVGFTMTLTESLMPNVVGVDIGCGMSLAKLRLKHIEYEKLDTVIREQVPVGGAVRTKLHRYADEINLDKLKCLKSIDLINAHKSIGTLGGGNHFIEIDKSDEGEYYLVVHSGSRKLGLEICTHYLKAGQKEAQMKKNTGYAAYEMTVLSGELLEHYLHDVKIAQEYAALNRAAMIDTITRAMKWKIEEEYSCIHNYIDFSHEVPIIRKGAISAKEGEKLIIPINMRDGIILAKGKGNPEWNYSAPHGAGRIHKRSEVANLYTVSDFKKEMQGVHTVCISKDTLDESPFAYRKLEDIQEAIAETAEIEKIIKPVYNYKAGEKK